MKKIKEVKLKKEINAGTYIIPIGYVLEYINYKHYKCRIVYNGEYVNLFSESDILANSDGKGTDTFQVEFEDENFGIEVPDFATLKDGYIILPSNRITPDIYGNTDLNEVFLSGNWFPSKAKAEAEAKRRKIKFALNKLRNEANEKFPIKEYSSYVLLIVYEVNIISCDVDSDSKGLFGFNNYNAVDYFRTKLDQSPELKAGLIELLERGSL